VVRRNCALLAAPPASQRSAMSGNKKHAFLLILDERFIEIHEVAFSDGAAFAPCCPLSTSRCRKVLPHLSLPESEQLFRQLCQGNQHNSVAWKIRALRMPLCRMRVMCKCPAACCAAAHARAPTPHVRRTRFQLDGTGRQLGLAHYRTKVCST
jgi:hypothetical protein